MKRRDFLKRGLATAGSVVLLKSGIPAAEAAAPDVRTIGRAKTDMTDGFYTPNRAPLQPTAFQRLPIGSITPKGWLRQQLLLQADGLNGRMPEVSDYLKYEGNGWVTPNTNVGWEEVPYWLRGFGDLGYVLGDQRIIALATQWLTGIIASQQPDGWFGPVGARTSLDGGPDLWPHMPVLRAMQSYAEYTKDPRVVPFLTKFFQYENGVDPKQFNKSWAATRWGDTLDTIFWTYNRTGDAFLLDLAKKIHANSADFVSGMPTWHNVNVSQGFREPAQYWLVSGDPKHLQAASDDYDIVMTKYGQFAGGGFAGDENSRPGFHDPRQGFETCGIAELMQSFEILTRISGDPKWSDRCEYIAFNSMPAALDPQQKGCHYITSPNSIQLDNEAKGKDFDNNWPMQVYEPGIHNYRCCPHNYGMAWPMYAEEMWLATADKGLCASLYAPSVVSAKVGDGTTVQIIQTTDYPYKDTVQMTLATPKSVSFPLYLRLPQWCANPTVKVNGKPVPVHAAPQSYLIVDRQWKSGDIVSLHFPMPIALRTWEQNGSAVTVDRGPLSYSLDIGEKWDRIDGTEQWPHYAVYATTPWNYGLIVDHANPSHAFDLIQKGGPLPANPWTHETNPLELRVKAKKIPQWQADVHNVVNPLQASPAKTTEATETITLIPMGAARLRITTFPTVGDGPDAHEWVTPAMPFHSTWKASASHVFSGDTLDALNDHLEPTASNDETIPRFTWWDHQGSAEWVQYDFPKTLTTGAVSVYWFDDTGKGQCRVPQSWRLLYKDGDTFKPVAGASAYGTARDGYNKVTFTPVITTALRLEVQLQDGFSGGILEWKVDQPIAAPTV
jgi:hypothetical protein